MKKSLLLTVAAAALTAPLSAQAAPDKKIDIGVAAAVNPDSRGLSAGRGDRLLMIGYDLEHKERILTSPQGRTQVLFIDESSLTVGPNADLTLDEFVFDPDKGTGKIAGTLTRGALRFVGGRISKNTPVEFKTPTAVIGVRGGVGSVSVDPKTGATQAILHFGRMTVTNMSGVTREITAPGFKVEVSAPNAPPTTPVKATAQEVGAKFNNFQGEQQTNGGAAERPTEARIAETKSAQAVTAQGSAAPPATVASAPPGTQNTQKTQSSQQSQQQSQQGDQQNQQQNQQQSGGQTTSTTALPPPPPPGGATGGGGEPTAVNNAVTTTQPAGETTSDAPPTTSTTTQNPPPTTTDTTQTTQNPPPTTTEPTPTTPAQETLALSGQLLAESPSITLPGGETVASPTSKGVLNGGLGSSANTFSQATRSDGRIKMSMSAGETIDVIDRVGRSALASGDAVSSKDGSIAGSMFLSQARDFLFVRGKPNSGGTEGLLFGGTPTPSGGKIVSNAARLDSYALESAIETNVSLSFAPKTLADSFSGARATPFYVVRQNGGTIGGDLSKNTGTLQVNLAISGQGSSQKSLISATTGSVAPTGGADRPNGLNQEVFGSAITAAQEPAIYYGARVSTVPDANGNGFFGGDLDYFVVDQNRTEPSGRVLDAGWIASTSGGPAERYGFTNVAMKTGSETAFNDRANAAHSGFAAGIVEFVRPGDTAPNRYSVMGKDGLPSGVTMDLRADSGRMAAVFSLSATAEVGPAPGFSDIELKFGGLDHSAGQSAIIDNRRFVAMNSTERASTFGGKTGRTDGAHASGDRSLLVSHELVPETGYLPSGVSFCECKFLNWGWWATDFSFGDQSDALLKDRRDHVHLGAWVTGNIPDVSELPASGTASYAGHAVGAVENKGARYVAAGSMNATYDFAKRGGNVAISNFDGRSFSVDVKGATSGAASFGGSVNALSAQTTINGAFARNGADAVGGVLGQFRHHENTGYTAVGIFAGQKQ